MRIADKDAEMVLKQTKLLNNFKSVKGESMGTPIYVNMFRTMIFLILDNTLSDVVLTLSHSKIHHSMLCKDEMTVFNKNTTVFLRKAHLSDLVMRHG